jgi:zinc transporter ZupT
MNPTLSVLLYASVAAGAASLGALPFALRGRLPLAWIGWANAVAAGLMLGVAHALLSVGMEGDAVRVAVGAALGIAFIALTHRATGTGELDLNRLDETRPEYGYQVLLVSTLHAGAEGVAIGTAMAQSVPFGAFTAAAIAVHNVPEATVLAAILTSRGVRRRDAAGLAVAADVNQVLLAVVTYALIAAAPSLLPWAVGFAVGALVYLVMAELLPEAYRQAGRTSIALATILAMAIVVLLDTLRPA